MALFFILSPFDPEKGSSWEGAFPAIFGALGGVVAGTAGAAVGATITQTLLRQRSSFWRALLGAVVGLVVAALCAVLLCFAPRVLGETFWVVTYLAVPIVGCTTIVAGAVIGSGWKAKPRDATSPPV